MIQLKISRQYLEDLCRFFLPYMVRVLEARQLTSKGTEHHLPAVVALSILEEMENMFQRKTLCMQQNFTIKLKKFEAILMMTTNQKTIGKHLLQGANIACCYSSGYRLRTSNHSPIMSFHKDTFKVFKPLLRKEKSGLLVLNKNKVRQLHGAAWLKVEYNKMRTKQAQAVTL